MGARHVPLQGLKPLIRYLAVFDFASVDAIYKRYLNRSMVESVGEITVPEHMAGDLWMRYFMSGHSNQKLFQMASTFDVREYGAIGLFFLISKNYRDIIDSFHLFSQLHRISDPLHYIQTDKYFIQQFFLMEKDPMVQKVGIVYSASLFYFTVRQLVDADHLLSHINFPLNQIDDAEKQELSDLFQVPIFFDSEALEMVYHREVIDHPLRFTDNGLRELLKDHLHGMGQCPTLEVDSDFVLKVKARISNLRTTHLLSAEVIAEELQLSRRTFDRRLSQLGYSFNSIKDEVFREHALMLMKQGYSAKDIAEELGFSNLSSFSRAFKRWTKSSPRQIKSLLFDSE